MDRAEPGLSASGSKRKPDAPGAYPQVGLMEEERPSRGPIRERVQLLNAMTVDVEEHFQVSGFADTVSRDDWERLPSRVVANTERVMQLLADHGVQATFFLLGWVAERQPGLVRRIADLGHEIASHGYSHRLVYEQRPLEFREETRRCKQLLEDLSGQPVLGYRAASFSIRRGNLWALETLAELGFAYDSSVFPIVHDRYGIPGAPRQIHRFTTASGTTIVEVPPSTLALGNTRFNVPLGGGGYLRFLPGAMSCWAIDRLNRRERMPAIVYVHPWELDPAQPRLRGRAVSRFRHYYGLRATGQKLHRLLGRFRFGSLRQVLAETGQVSRSTASSEKSLCSLP